jgi:serine/threonine-protein kinase
MLFRMLTGRLPEQGVRAGDYNPDLGQTWDQFFVRALATDRAKRFSSAQEMRKALKALHTEWLEHLETACSLADIQPPGEVFGPGAGALRAKPATVDEEEAKDALDLDDLWRPRVYCACKYKDLGDGVVADKINGLFWQRLGSPYPLTLDEAGDYLRELNEQRFGGRVGWRLPTAAELKLLLRPVRRREDHCMDPVFGTAQTRIWTTDGAGEGKAWFADADLGFFAAQDTACRLHVRAVCGNRP